MVEKIVHDGVMLGIIVGADFHKDGIEFFTPDDFSQQLAYMSRPAGYTIPPHTHNRVPREVVKTLETLFIRKGKVRVDFYTAEQAFVCSRVIGAGDVLLLVAGGHGFEILEPAEFIEVKQGPYAGDQDKVRFEGVRNG
jgi:hypothetical protein